MKLYPNNIAQVITQVKNGIIKGLLLYGPDKGMINDLCNQLSSKLSFPDTIYEYEAPALNSLLNNKSFFAAKELIKFTEVPATINAEAKEILLKDNLHFPIFVADELATTSSLRKFFETENCLAIIACYPDEEKSVRQIIAGKISSEGKMINGEAMNYLLHHLHGDRLLIHNELNKLLAFTHDHKEITLKDCQQVISLDSQPVADLLCIYYAKEQYAQFFIELDKLLATNVPVVWVVRALSRFYTNLLTVKLLMADGELVDTCMSKLRPPIFFKYVAPFRELALKLSLNDVMRQLEKLTEAEIQAKTGGESEQLLQQLIFN